MKPKQLTKPRVEEVEINITGNPGCFTDVVVILYAKGFFDRVWKLKEEFDPYEEYPILDKAKAHDHYLNTFFPLRQERIFTTQIRELRSLYGLPTHYENLIHKLIFTGVIENGDYKKAYYSTVNVYYDEGPNDFEEVQAILIHQGTRVEDLALPLREFHNQYETKTKTGRQFLPKMIKAAPEYLKAYLLPEHYNKFAVDQFPEIETNYSNYRKTVLFGKKPQKLALEKLGYSESQYNLALRNQKNDYDDEYYKLVNKVKLQAKNISHGIERVKDLLKLK